MAPHLMRAERFLDRLREWAGEREEVRALVAIGSFARGEYREGSDLDVVVVARDPGAFVNETSWVSTFGVAENVALEAYGAVTSVRALYADGLEVEFGVAPADWAAEPLDAGTERVARGGMVVLLDRDGPATALAAKALSPERAP